MIFRKSKQQMFPSQSDGGVYLYSWVLVTPPHSYLYWGVKVEILFTVPRILLHHPPLPPQILSAGGGEKSPPLSPAKDLLEPD